MPVKVRYEAEDADVKVGGPPTVNNPNASKQKVLGFLETGRSFGFNNVIAGNQLTVAYYTNANTSVNLYINGTFAQTIQLPYADIPRCGI